MRFSIVACLACCTAVAYIGLGKSSYAQPVGVVGAGAKDPPDSHYELPSESDPERLLAFLESVALFKSADDGNGTLGVTEVRRHMRRSSKAMAAALDKLFAGKATEDQRVKAIEVAVGHLRNQVQGFSANGQDADLIEALARVSANGGDRIQQKVADLQPDFQCVWYGDLSADERAALAEEVVRTIHSSDMNPAAASRLTRFCNAAEMAGDSKLAARVVERLQPLAKKADPTRRDWILGLLRRLRLPGKSYEYVGTIRNLADPVLPGPKLSPKLVAGKLVVVHYFDEGSGAEFDQIQALCDKLRGGEVEFVGVYIGHQPYRPFEVFQKQPIASWPILVWQEGWPPGPEAPTAVRYGVTRAPHTMLIGRHGKVINANVSLSSLEKELQAAMKSK